MVVVPAASEPGPTAGSFWLALLSRCSRSTALWVRAAAFRKVPDACVFRLREALAVRWCSGSVRSSSRAATSAAGPWTLAQNGERQQHRLSAVANGPCRKPAIRNVACGTRHLFAVRVEGLSVGKGFFDDFWPERLSALKRAVESAPRSSDD